MLLGIPPLGDQGRRHRLGAAAAAEPGQQGGRGGGVRKPRHQIRQPGVGGGRPRSPARASTCATTVTRSARRAATRSRTPITRAPNCSARQRDSSPDCSSSIRQLFADQHRFAVVYHGGMRIQSGAELALVAVLCAAASMLLAPARAAGRHISMRAGRRRSPCPAVEVIFARGRLEPPAPGVIGNAFVSALRSKVNKNIGLYAVNYPADNQIDVGANDMSQRIQYNMNNCPNTRLVLGGYSLGAAATDMVLAVPISIMGFKTPCPPTPTATSRPSPCSATAPSGWVRSRPSTRPSRTAPSSCATAPTRSATPPTRTPGRTTGPITWPPRT